MFPHCNPHYNTMHMPFSAGHIVLSPTLKLDNTFFPVSVPTFHHQADNSSFGDILLTGQFGETNRPPPPPEPPAATKEKATLTTTTTTTRSKKAIAVGRKRALRKDRHSKIRTAQGLRDRRMRLSLEVAPEFFHIQDMLGFDKASKTLRWLITAAKPAIQELTAASRPKTSASDIGGAVEFSTSELAESGDMTSTVSDNKGKPADQSSRKRESDGAVPKAKRACRRRPPSRKAALPATIIAKESRLKARARARERTEKRTLLQSSVDHLLSSSVPFGAVKEDSCTHHLKSSLDQLVAELEEHCTHSPNQHQQLGTGGRSSELPVAVFDSNQSPMCPYVDTVNLLINEQWDMERILQAHVQLQGWEA